MGYKSQGPTVHDHQCAMEVFSKELLERNIKHIYLIFNMGDSIEATKFRIPDKFLKDFEEVNLGTDINESHGGPAFVSNLAEFLELFLQDMEGHSIVFEDQIDYYIKKLQNARDGEAEEIEGY